MYCTQVIVWSGDSGKVRLNMGTSSPTLTVDLIGRVFDRAARSLNVGQFAASSDRYSNHRQPLYVAARCRSHALGFWTS